MQHGNGRPRRQNVKFVAFRNQQTVWEQFIFNILYIELKRKDGVGW